jgi:hypothetical protein
MRGFTVGLVVVIFSALALGQAGGRGIAGYCPYGCGPYVPLLTTPSVAFETVSSSPVGASNATGGLLAGARNGTLGMIPANVDAVHTEMVWYSGGGSPAVSPVVWLPHPEPMGMREGRAERAPEFMGAHERHEERMENMERAPVEQAHLDWTYYVGPVAGVNPAGGKHAARTYTNADVDRVAAKSEPFRRN